MRSLTAISLAAGAGLARAAAPAGARRRPPPPACSPRSPTTSPTARACSAGSRSPPKTTWNVVGECGDAGRAADAGGARPPRRRPHRRDLRPDVPDLAGRDVPRADRADRHVVPAVVGAARRARAGRARCAARAAAGCSPPGAAGSAVGLATFADVARSPIVPGANDNLSAVAVLVALAERLRDEPIDGLRVLLASCGAEEVIQGGIYGFARRHFPALDRDRTWFLNLETVGSPRLVMLEGEGPVMMEDYHDRGFRDLVCAAAQRAGVPVLRGLRARNSTDAVHPQPGRLSDGDAGLGEPPQGAVELPPDERHRREPGLRHRAPGADRHRGGRPRAGRQPLDRRDADDGRDRTGAGAVRLHGRHPARRAVSQRRWPT